MKLLALCALAEKCVGTGGEVTYAQVAEVLSCGADEVEGGGLFAPSARRLVEAKMDQVRGVAVITRVTHRVFGDVQWKELAANIQTWRDNVDGMGKAVAKSLRSGNATLTKESIAAH